jgi:hypothetical protein
LLEWVRVRLLCRDLGIAAVHAAPKAVAFTPRDDCTDALKCRFKDAQFVEGRILIPFEEQGSENQLPLVLAMLSRNG